MLLFVILFDNEAYEEWEKLETERLRPPLTIDGYLSAK